VKPYEEEEDPYEGPWSFSEEASRSPQVILRAAKIQRAAQSRRCNKLLSIVILSICAEVIILLGCRTQIGSLTIPGQVSLTNFDGTIFTGSKVREEHGEETATNSSRGVPSP
jgi:hypothetical protein